MEQSISVVIRTLNEGRHIEQVLKSLRNQTYKNFEIVMVDSGSTDQTLSVAQKYGARIIHIEKSRFNYSYASNVGVENSKGELVCFLSGHSVPRHNNFLEEINRAFENPKIGGCYGDVLALPDGSLTEKLFDYLGYLKNKLNGNSPVLETSIHPGILSCSNASMRKCLVDAHPFVEALGRGGEDVEQAYRIIEDGYYIAKVPSMLVLHSHGSHFLKFISEYRSWQKMFDQVEEYIGHSKTTI